MEQKYVDNLYLIARGLELAEIHHPPGDERENASWIQISDAHALWISRKLQEIAENANAIA
jgi:hypothetical protein